MEKEDRYIYVFEPYDGSRFVYDSKYGGQLETLSECADLLNSKDNEIQSLREEIKKETQKNKELCKTFENRIDLLEETIRIAIFELDFAINHSQSTNEETSNRIRALTNKIYLRAKEKLYGKQ